MSASNTARALLATLVLCAIALLSSSAFAQARATDGPRLRGGFSLVAGPYVAYDFAGRSALGGVGCPSFDVLPFGNCDS